MPEPSRAVLAVIEEIVFRSKIEAAAAPLGIAVRLVTAEEASRAALDRRWSLVLIDLNSSTTDPLPLLATLRRTHPTTPIIGYCAHGQTHLQQQAQGAGCTAVLPRSALVQGLPQLLADADGTWIPRHIVGRKQ